MNDDQVVVLRRPSFKERAAVAIEHVATNGRTRFRQTPVFVHQFCSGDDLRCRQLGGPTSTNGRCARVAGLIFRTLRPSGG